jgi:hypothetical protein
MEKIEALERYKGTQRTYTTRVRVGNWHEEESLQNTAQILNKVLKVFP